MTIVHSLGRISAVALFVLTSAAVAAESPTELYQQLRSFQLSEQAVRLDNVSFNRDRVTLTLSGVLYFAQPVYDRVTGAVFIGEGRLTTEPWSDFEKGSVQRFLKSDVVDVGFKTAVFRFTDDTYDILLDSGSSVSGNGGARAAGLTENLEDRHLKQSGMSLSSRLLLSLLHNETPGFFFAELDGGGRGKYAFLLDHQARVPASVFGIDGGEKGMLYRYDQFDNDVWTAFYNQADFERGAVDYASVFDIVHITRYQMDIDLTKPGDWLRFDTTIDLVALQDGVRLIPLNLNEGLSEYRDVRKEKGVRVLSAETAEGIALKVLQEEWQSGFTIVLSEALSKGQEIALRLKLEGKDSLLTSQSVFHYPRSTTTWYPRHGHLQRAEYDLSFRHPQKTVVVSVGERTEEGPDPNDDKVMRTRWRMTEPVALVTFAVGRFERHDKVVETDSQKIPIELYSAPGGYQAIKESFILAELGNGLLFFDKSFGRYPYGRLGAVYFPRGFGQGFPSLLLLPSEGKSDRYQFAFISHEGAHQWWGNIVGWRSYRDQWMSEGFAEYSGMLYTWMRDSSAQMLKLVSESRRELREPPQTTTGILEGTVSDIGPLILGQRLSSSRSKGAYTTLIYQKGALVLRMLHLLFSDLSSGDAEPFFDMMRDFVERYRNRLATTEDFMQVASEHFVKTSVARKYKLPDLTWFFQQWVYQTALPSYRLEYSVRKKDGKPFLAGTIYQDDAPEGWFMPIPVVMDFGGGQVGRTLILAYGAKREFGFPLPKTPKKIELDPDMWVLSKNTSTKKVK